MSQQFIFNGLLINSQWIHISVAVEHIIEKIMMPPREKEDYILNTVLGHGLLRQGKYFGCEFINLVSAYDWYEFIAERYSCSLDFWYVLSMRLISYGVPMIIISLMSLSTGYISPKIFVQQVTFSSPWFINDQSYYDHICTDMHMCILSLTIFHLCKKFKINTMKVFGGLMIASFTFRSFVISTLYINGSLVNQKYRVLYDSNDFSQYYIYCFAFLLGEYHNKYQIQPKMLYNKRVWKKAIKFPFDIKMSTAVLGSVASLLVIWDTFVEVKVQQINQASIEMLITRVFIFPIYLALSWITFYIEIISKYQVGESTRQQCKKGKFTVPGNNKILYTTLAAEPLFAIIKHQVGDTVIGPYHTRVFLIITIGILVCQYILGEILFALFQWFVQGFFGTCATYFDSLKRKRITQLIKESIYSGTE
ncbi:Conserved_hypothetical protein [Hexamita inflata]|uniref:Uncharacterized protein n=1 Tax=Hexamita inflata TaxID=28002 RepID=A0AA86R8P2_9EUKA|nr:Conserved hypothetical protein [Hexamita inflata]CAI9968343.1 Conserved hypothetical protein [Hexamita inflata]